MSATTLDEARSAIQRGERVHARKILRVMLMENPKDEQAWLMMARVVDTQEQVIDCLERALKINPQNLATQRALEALRHPHPAHVQAPAAPVTTVVAPQKPDTSQAILAEQIAAKAVESDHDKSTAAMMAAATTVGIATKPEVSPRKVTPRKAAPKPMLEAKIRPPRRYVNWSLLIGSTLVIFVAILSAWGPKLATGDPLKENVIIKAGDTWYKPPFSPLEVPGFPLGSDQFGRDLFSRILYAIQPTMMMVAIVALVRLFLGTIIGMGAGWSRGRTGRVLDTMISAALSVPVFMVALGAIAMLGAVGGNLLALATALKAPASILVLLKDASTSTFDQILPFVIGLSINGWGETARIVREQTHAVRGQLYIEAALAMGASSGRTLRQHVLRQIMSMVWMLFAFEISSTLMVTAGLGFLGYYIGGDVWIEVADFVSRRVSGTPELGQMLATSWATLTEPWPMVLTGSVVFLTVLGFNLLGEGLRVRQSPENINRNSIFARAWRTISFSTEEYLTYPIGNWLQHHGRAVALAGALITVVILGGFWVQDKLGSSGSSSGQSITVPGENLWSGELGEPMGTRGMPSEGLVKPGVSWQVQIDDGLTNGLAISKDGTIYLGSLGKKLMAINPDGTTQWESSLLETPMGAPAIGIDGTIYIADTAGGLTAFNQQGEQLWHYAPSERGKPTHGVVAAGDGTIYYLLENPQSGDTLLAMNPDSSLRWSTATGTKTADTALRLSPDGEEIYVKNQAIDAETGEVLPRELPTAEDPVLGGREQLFIGADQQRYMQAGHNVIHWKVQGGDFKLIQTAEWNYQSAGFNQYSSFPTDAGVSSDQKIWLFYSVQYGGTTIIWLEPDGEVIGISSMPFAKDSIVAGIDGQSIAYICGLEPDIGDQPAPKCTAYQRGNTQPAWEIELVGSRAEVSAAALAMGKLYIVTEDGFLFVVGEGESTGGSQSQAFPTSEPTEESRGLPSRAEETPTASAELVWSYQFPEPVGGGLSEQEDGSLIAMTVNDVLIHLDAEGQLVTQIEVRPVPYHHPEGKFIIYPIGMSNGTYLVISAEKLVYAIDASGNKLWEAAIEANPAGYYEQRGDTVYLADQTGNLYAFGSDGLIWQFKPAGATKAANQPTIGPDGTLYYVVIIERRVYVQEVKPDGTGGWQAPVKTGFFTYDLQINGAGTLLFLRDDIFDVQKGVRLDMVPPVRVDEYIMGEDGLNYLRTDHVVSQWELNGNEMVITKTASWNYQHMGRPPFMTIVTAQKVIWLYYGDTLVWLDLDGSILNTIPLENSTLQWWDTDNTRYTSCQQPIRSDQLNCKMYTTEESSPVWEVSITGLPDTEWGWVTDDGLTAMTEEDVAYRMFVDWPEP
jgi:ABC-type dipeptide/oligopeptide/nickel transport system permease subunit